MELNNQQKIEILKCEIENLEFGKRHYSDSPIYKNQLQHQIQMKKYDAAIAAKYKLIEKLKQDL